ncbi:MAG: phosphate regulon sensor histidine kinase PhoR [Halioglobus sp.]
MEWLSLVSRILFFVAAGGALGWYLGSPMAGMLAGSLAVLLFWSLQMWRLQSWLRDTSQPPPDVPGIWGEMVARIYKQQRVATATQERLQSTVDYLLESFAAMRDGVIIVESSGAIRWCNEAAQKLLGLRYPDDIGQAITNLVRLPEFNEYLDVADYSEPLVFETTDDLNLHLQLVVTRFAEGDTLLFIRDVTDVVRTEQMRSDFVGNVSHELRTPLTVISGYVANFLADSESLPAPYLRALQQMAGQAERMENLLKDLLWLSRIESAQHHDKKDHVDMGALLEELQEELSNMETGKSLELSIGCREKISGEYRELYSAVSNLVLNAYKYSPEAGKVFASWTQDGEGFRLDIRDEGIGIDSSHFPRLTERFYRVDDSRSSATGGTGLGLAIVKHVAAAHGAQLKIDSKLGQGSTFSLIFPAQS